VVPVVAAATPLRLSTDTSLDSVNRNRLDVRHRAGRRPPVNTTDREHRHPPPRSGQHDRPRAPQPATPQHAAASTTDREHRRPPPRSTRRPARPTASTATRHPAAQRSPAQHSAARPSTAQPGPAQRSPAQHSPAHHSATGAARPTTAQPGPPPRAGRTLRGDWSRQPGRNEAAQLSESPGPRRPLAPRSSTAARSRQPGPPPSGGPGGG
jgi:hypothetical protein